MAGPNDGEAPAAPAQMPLASLRTPEFMPDKPELWFSIMEGYFANANITADVTKFNHIVFALDSRYTRQVEDIILNPPTENMYQKLKDALVNRLSASQQEKSRQLLQKEVIGDRKPSQFLRDLRSLGGSSFNDEILRTIWLSRLPEHMQPSLALLVNEPLDKLAELADIMLTTMRGTSSQVCELNHTGSSAEAALGTKMTQLMLGLQKELDAMKLQIEAIASSRARPQFSGRSRNRSRSRSRARSSSRRRPDGVCWYHHRFGAEANKCLQPCAFSGNANGSR